MNARTALAFAASLIAPGSVQIAHGNWTRGLKLYTAGLVLSWGAFVLLFRTFTGLGVWAALLLAFGIAVGSASVRRQPPPRKQQVWLGGAAALTYPCLLFASLIGATPARLYRVPSESMQPTIEPGEIIVVDSAAYCLNSPERGDVVVFAHPRYPNLELIKRVVGLAGELVVLPDGERVRIDGKKLTEPYLSRGRVSFPTRAYDPTSRIAPEDIFVLGDNRTESIDSRTFGAVPIAALSGRARYVLSSPLRARLGQPL